MAGVLPNGEETPAGGEMPRERLWSQVPVVNTNRNRLDNSRVKSRACSSRCRHSRPGFPAFAQVFRSPTPWLFPGPIRAGSRVIDQFAHQSLR